MGNGRARRLAPVVGRGWELVALTSRFPTPRPECYIATFKRERLR
jgi:hypothetical protein